MLSKPVKTLTQIGLASLILVGAVACAPEYGEREGSLREREGFVEPRVGERESEVEREGGQEREIEVERD